MPRVKKKTAAKKTSAKRATMTKADFVRSLPSDTPAKDVVAKAAEQNIKLDDTYVYKIRTLDKKAGKTKGRTAKGKPGPKPKASTPLTSNGSVTAFYKAVKAVGGIVQAKALLANIEAFQNA